MHIFLLLARPGEQDDTTRRINLWSCARYNLVLRFLCRRFIVSIAFAPGLFALRAFRLLLIAFNMADSASRQRTVLAQTARNILACRTSRSGLWLTRAFPFTRHGDLASIPEQPSCGRKSGGNAIFRIGISPPRASHSFDTSQYLNGNKANQSYPVRVIIILPA